MLNYVLDKVLSTKWYIGKFHSGVVLVSLKQENNQIIMINENNGTILDYATTSECWIESITKDRIIIKSYKEYIGGEEETSWSLFENQEKCEEYM